MRTVTVIIAIIFLCSCSSLNRFTYDKYLQEHTLKIELKPNAYIHQKSLLKSYSLYNSLGLEHFGKVSDSGEKTVYLTITHEYDEATDPPGSILFIDIDDNHTKLTAHSQSTRQVVSAETMLVHKLSNNESTLDLEGEENGSELIRTSTTTLNTLERTKQVYEIPVELFESLASARKLTFRQYIGNQAIDIIPTLSERRAIVSFYRSIIQKQ